MKAPTKAQLLYAAGAIFEARVIVERYLQSPSGKLDVLLHELEMGYFRQADALTKNKPPKQKAKKKLPSPPALASPDRPDEK